jgi:ATP-binding cassette, subfamily C (CFTR/MRP), member 1
VLHDRLLDKVFSLPMSFFDTQPSGRLISRFSKDVASTDLNLPSLFLALSQCIVGTLVSTAVVTGATSGAVMLAVVPLVPVYLSVQRHYLATSRELNRLASVTSSPILTHFGETLAGLMTVRAFGKQVNSQSTITVLPVCQGWSQTFHFD